MTNLVAIMTLLSSESTLFGAYYKQPPLQLRLIFLFMVLLAHKEIGRLSFKFLRTYFSITTFFSTLNRLIEKVSA